MAEADEFGLEDAPLGRADLQDRKRLLQVGFQPDFGSGKDQQAPVL
ncbi:MAG: hypothetical protein IPG33_14530 [Betaproteobacteria bacterium]|nr:hypothetical protein [Betaproteobacteria bacterium]